MSLPKHIEKHIYQLYEVYYDDNKYTSFSNILKLYYTWATKDELHEMYKLILPIKSKKIGTSWINNIYTKYKNELILLFGIIDTDSNNVIDLQEFINAIKLTNIKIDNENIEILFKNADTDNNGVLDIFEFVNLISNNSTLRSNFINILNAKTDKLKYDNNKRLSIIFNDIPNSPIRTNWRPSLSNLKSPNSIKKNLTRSNINY